jgi:hypothetical protein
MTILCMFCAKRYDAGRRFNITGITYTYLPCHSMRCYRIHNSSFRKGSTARKYQPFFHDYLLEVRVAVNGGPLPLSIKSICDTSMDPGRVKFRSRVRCCHQQQAEGRTVVNVPEEISRLPVSRHCESGSILSSLLYDTGLGYRRGACQ